MNEVEGVTVTLLLDLAVSPVPCHDVANKGSQGGVNEVVVVVVVVEDRKSVV